MFALMVLFAFGVYLLCSLFIIWLARYCAKQLGHRPWIWGWVSALLMYNVVFWDLIPSYVLYHNYQANESGLWVYKTVDQWRAENPGVEQTLTRKEYGGRFPVPGTDSVRYPINQRFEWWATRTRRWPGITRIKYEVLDVKEQSVMVRAIYFQSGDCTNPQYYRFWVQRCGAATQHGIRNYFELDKTYFIGRIEE